MRVQLPSGSAISEDIMEFERTYRQPEGLTLYNEYGSVRMVDQYSELTPSWCCGIWHLSNFSDYGDYDIEPTPLEFYEDIKGAYIKLLVAPYIKNQSAAKDLAGALRYKQLSDELSGWWDKNFWSWKTGLMRHYFNDDYRMIQCTAATHQTQIFHLLSELSSDKTSGWHQLKLSRGLSFFYTTFGDLRRHRKVLFDEYVKKRTKAEALASGGA